MKNVLTAHAMKVNRVQNNIFQNIFFCVIHTHRCCIPFPNEHSADSMHRFLDFTVIDNYKTDTKGKTKQKNTYFRITIPYLNWKSNSFVCQYRGINTIFTIYSEILKSETTSENAFSYCKLSLFKIPKKEIKPVGVCKIYFILLF